MTGNKPRRTKVRVPTEVVKAIRDHSVREFVFGEVAEQRRKQMFSELEEQRRKQNALAGFVRKRFSKVDETFTEIIKDQKEFAGPAQNTLDLLVDRSIEAKAHRDSLNTEIEKIGKDHKGLFVEFGDAIHVNRGEHDVFQEQIKGASKAILLIGDAHKETKLRVDVIDDSISSIQRKSAHDAEQYDQNFDSLKLHIAENYKTFSDELQGLELHQHEANESMNNVLQDLRETVERKVDAEDTKKISEEVSTAVSLMRASHTGLKEEVAKINEGPLDVHDRDVLIYNITRGRRGPQDVGDSKKLTPKEFALAIQRSLDRVGAGGGSGISVLSAGTFVVNAADFDSTSMPNAIDINDIAITTRMTSIANGDIFYYDDGFKRLGKGDNADVLTLDSGLPSWAAPGGGTTHTLDSVTHTDVAAITEATGQMLYYTAGGSWDALDAGDDDQVLTLAGGVPTWAAAGSGTVTEAFKTITGITNDVVADEATDTLTLASADAKLTIVGTSATDTITFTVVEGEIDHDALTNFAENEHFTQAAIVATGTIASGVWEGTAIADEFIAGAAGWDAKTDYAFTTITGITNDVVAEAAGDTLTLASADAKLTIVGTAATDTITFTIDESEIDHNALTNYEATEHVNWAAAAAGTIHTDNYIEGGAGTDTTAIHDNVANEITAITAITTALAADEFVLEDQSDSFNKKAITFANLFGSAGLDDLKETSLSAPGADRVVFWDHSDTAFEFLTLGTGLTITTNDLAFTTKTATIDLPVTMGAVYLDGASNDVDIAYPQIISNQPLITITTNDTDQDGEIWWRVQLPDDFSSFASDAIKYYNYVSDTTNCTVTFSVTDLTDTFTDGAQNNASITQTTITAAELTGASVASSAGSIIVLKARVVGDAADIGYIGGVTLYYNKT